MVGRRERGCDGGGEGSVTDVGGHDPDVLRRAREFLDAADDNRVVLRRLDELVADNRHWRGEQCINLVAAESPTSRPVRGLLAAEVGTRASGGHIGPGARWFVGMRYIDEIEALCVELLKRLFNASFADHRPMGGLAACSVAFAALTRPGDVIMSIAERHGETRVTGLMAHPVPTSYGSLTSPGTRLS